MLVVLWVWAEKSQLTVAFSETCVWPNWLLRHVVTSSYQGLMGAVITYERQLVPMH